MPVNTAFEIRILSDYLDSLTDSEYLELVREYSSISPQRHNHRFSDRLYDMDEPFEGFAMRYREAYGKRECSDLRVGRICLIYTVPDMYTVHEWICYGLFKDPANPGATPRDIGKERGPLRFRTRYRPYRSRRAN